MAGFVWREGLWLSPKGHRALPFLVQQIAALNNSFLRNWTRVSCRGHVSVRLHTYSAFWWAAQGAWAQFCRLLPQLASWRWMVAQEPGVLTALGHSLSMQKQSSGQVSVLFGHHLGERATCDACNHICLQGGCWRGWVLPVWADILQHQECSPDEQRCWRASAPRETASRSWKGNPALCWQQQIEKIRLAFFSPSCCSYSKGMRSIFLCAFSGETRISKSNGSLQSVMARKLCKDFASGCGGSEQGDSALWHMP